MKLSGGRSRVHRSFLLALPVFVLIALGLVTACDVCNPWEPCLHYHDFSFSNETEEQLSVRVGSVGRSSQEIVPPGETRRLEVGLYDSRGDARWNDKDDLTPLRIYDEEGCLATVMPTTVREIEDEFDSHIVMTPADLTPAEERTDCNRERAPPIHTTEPGTIS